MLKFIDDNDFLLVDKYKQNDDGSVSWTYKDGDTTHSGFLREGMTREIQVEDGIESVKVGTKLVKTGVEQVKMGETPVLDENGEQTLDDSGMPIFEDVFENEDIFSEQDVFEDQTKYKTETIDVWSKFQSLAITVDVDHLLVELKQKSQDIVNKLRDNLNNADIEYNGHMFQAGAQSREDIMGAVVTASDTIWLTRDNQEVEMTAEDMRGLGLAIANRKKFLVYKARHFKDALAALDNETAINDYLDKLDWSA